MTRAPTVRAAMQNAQTLNVVRLKASQMLSASESKVTMVSMSRFAGLRPTSLCEVGLFRFRVSGRARKSSHPHGRRLYARR
jgi:hypothetical protein